MRLFSNTTRAILAGAALATTLMSTASAQPITRLAPYL